MTRLVLLLLAAAAAQAQFVSIGGKAGSPLKDPVSNQNLSPFSTFSPGRWTGGPTVEFHFPLRLSLEFDALYHSSRATTAFPASFGPTTVASLASSSQRTKVWDFPLLLKYHLIDGPVRPFVSAGYSWTRESTLGVQSYQCLGTAGSCTLPGFNLPPRGGPFEYTIHRRGPVAGGGVDLKSSRVTISPEVRFTRLSSPNANELIVMVGFTFKPFRR